MIRWHGDVDSLIGSPPGPTHCSQQLHTPQAPPTVVCPDDLFPYLRPFFWRPCPKCDSLQLVVATAYIHAMRGAAPACKVALVHVNRMLRPHYVYRGLATTCMSHKAVVDEKKKKTVSWKGFVCVVLGRHASNTEDEPKRTCYAWEIVAALAADYSQVSWIYHAKGKVGEKYLLAKSSANLIPFGVRVLCKPVTWCYCSMRSLSRAIK